jgi:hypothetical protein
MRGTVLSLRKGIRKSETLVLVCLERSPDRAGWDAASPVSRDRGYDNWCPGRLGPLARPAGVPFSEGESSRPTWVTFASHVGLAVESL